jgi:pimeloyl-ACP methyl ester carboxylesterase/DNA-binding winged helix-turn-helix (wHTH) protein
MRSAVPSLQAAGRVSPPQLAFGPFRLDPANEMLTRDGRPVRLRPKAFAMLSHLVASAGCLVTKKDLLDALWADVFVGDAALKTCMREIREALGDDAQQPRYIETAHRRGYRFIASVDRPAAGASADSVFTAPYTQYARHGDVNIAYQVVGNGPIDLVFAPGWVSHLDYMWAEPSYACFLVRLASFARLILFDTRGTGRSDRARDLPTPGQRVSDLRAVLDAAGSRRAALVGVADGGPICTLFAATHPERTRGLVMVGSYARGTRAPDHPWARTAAQHQESVETIVREWGGPVGIDECAPSRAADVRFRTWWSHYLRVSASPSTAVALATMNADLDVRDVLPAIRVPTLIVHRRGDRSIPVEGARYMADRIASARLVELAGQDHLPFVGDQDAIVDEVDRFLTSPRQTEFVDQILATA